MPRPHKSRIETNLASSEVTAAGTASSPSTLSPDQVRRWAALIADGRAEVPNDLPPDDGERLQREVRLLLRGRLVRLVARAIASDLYREFGRKESRGRHDRAQV